MLESLFNSAGTIHDLNMEGAFPEPKLYQPRELYEALKETVLYDRERGQWNSCLSEGQELIDLGRRAKDQLLGLLAEAQFNPQVACEGYEALKRSPLYDVERGQWNFSMRNGQEFIDLERTAEAQLLGLLVEAQFNPQAACEGYEALKQGPLYDAERRQWICAMTEEQKLDMTDRFSSAQLLGVLVETQFNPQVARERYEVLKQTPLYDAERRQWIYSMNEEQELEHTNHFSFDQLLGVLVEAQFNPQTARERYEALKQTALYDAERRQWSASAEGQELRGLNRYAHNQLLAVLVEAKLLETPPPKLTRDVPPLPITRSW